MTYQVSARLGGVANYPYIPSTHLKPKPLFLSLADLYLKKR